MEIERKFLLVPCSMKRFLKKLEISYRKVPIEQFYLKSSVANAERYRHIGGRYVHTQKSGAGMVRREIEKEVSKDEYLRQKERNRGGVIEKKRYIFQYEDWTYELDAFKGVLKGLNFLEIEFPDPKSANAFQLPEPFRKICLDEVTDNGAFTNGSISKRMRIPTIEERLGEILKRVDSERKDFFKASISVSFHPFESTKHTLKALIYSMVRSIQANRVAILAGDRDPERLHQLRVAMRKLRSLFSLMGKSFDSEWREHQKERLSALMEATGPKRDLDVTLLEMDHYRSLIPKKYHAGLDKLEQYLRKRVDNLDQALKEFLLDDTIQSELESLLDFSKRDGSDGLSNVADLPVIFPVKEILFKRYRKLLREGGRLDPNSSATAYHRVRIDVKKLRYMMEFFSPILEEEAYAKLLKRVKEIQTILGDHQDLEVQSEHLREMLNLPELGSPELRDAIHALRKEMKNIIGLKRKEFLKSFREFGKSGELIHRMICHF